MTALAWTAVATFVLAGFAGLAALLAWLALTKESKQLKDERAASLKQAGVLELQSQELKALGADREREARERRAAQSRQVAIWELRHEFDPRIEQVQRAKGTPAPYTVQAWLQNGSPYVIFDVTFRWHLGSQFKGQTPTRSALPPGEKLDALFQLPNDFPPTGDKETLGAVAYFRDFNGVCWRARPDGGSDEEIRREEMPVPEGDRI